MLKLTLATSLITGHTIEFYEAIEKPSERFKIVPSERQRMARRMIFGSAKRVDVDATAS